jgi:hypothetical protein
VVDAATPSYEPDMEHAKVWRKGMGESEVPRQLRYSSGPDLRLQLSTIRFAPVTLNTSDYLPIYETARESVILERSVLAMI